MSSSSRTAWLIQSLSIQWAEGIKCTKETVNEQYFACRNPKHSAPQSYTGNTQAQTRTTITAVSKYKTLNGFAHKQVYLQKEQLRQQKECYLNLRPTHKKIKLNMIKM
jgi:hypothetical protein